MAEPARTLHTLDSSTPASEQTPRDTPISGVRGLAVHDSQEPVTEPDLAEAAYSQAVALYDSCVRCAVATERDSCNPQARAKALTMRFETDPPCDFLAYLEWRLGQDADATVKLLGEWLATYEPARGAARSVSSAITSARSAAGIKE
jgi:hypothetical protein